MEEDIAEDRLRFWIARSGQSPTSHDAVDGKLIILIIFFSGSEESNVFFSYKWMVFETTGCKGISIYIVFEIISQQTSFLGLIWSKLEVLIMLTIFAFDNEQLFL